MKLGALLGWGIVIYAVTSLTASAAAAYGIEGTFLASFLQLMVLVAVCIIAGSSLKFLSWKDIFPYSISWAFIAVLLDAFIAVPVIGWGLYAQWSAWCGYALVALLPLLAVMFKRRRSTPGGVWES